jgi:Flp pilus assembly protein CpaB
VRNRSNLLVLLGIAFFVVGGIIVYALTNDSGSGNSPAAGGPVNVVVATQDIPAGALAKDMIEQGHLKLEKVLPTQLVPNAVQSIQQLSTGTFVQGFAKGQQITQGGLQSINRAFKVPEGFEAIAVQIDFVAGGAGYVNPGDKINLYGAYPTLSGSPAPRAELLVTNIQVLDVNLAIPARRGTVDPNATRATGDNVTYLLAVKTADAEKLVFTTQFDSLYATLTAENAPPAGPTPGRDGGTILEVEPNVAAG